jgi:hypothetical protein
VAAHIFSLGILIKPRGEPVIANTADGVSDATPPPEPAAIDNPLQGVESDVRLGTVVHKYQLSSHPQMLTLAFKNDAVQVMSLH